MNVKRTITVTVEEYNDQEKLIKKTTTVTEEIDEPMYTPIKPILPLTPTTPINPQPYQPLWQPTPTYIDPYKITCKHNTKEQMYQNINQSLNDMKPETPTTAYDTASITATHKE